MKKCIGILIACLCAYGLTFAMGTDDSASQKKAKNSVEMDCRRRSGGAAGDD